MVKKSHSQDFNASGLRKTLKIGYIKYQMDIRF
jgi:hypothetical protein